MVIGRVVDDMVSTQKIEPLHGRKLLLVQPLHLAEGTWRKEDGEEYAGGDWGEEVLAIDGADAGVGEVVLLVQDGFAAMHVLGRFHVPVEAAVIGVVDRIDRYHRESAEKEDRAASKLPANGSQE